MAIASFEVSTYDVRLARQLDIQVDGQLVSYQGCITCRGSEYTLVIYFLSDSSLVPDNAFNAGQKLGTMYLPQSQLPWFVDLLRNERPIYCFLSSSYPNQNGLYTGAEPVGEAE